MRRLTKRFLAELRCLDKGTVSLLSLRLSFQMKHLIVVDLSNSTSAYKFLVNMCVPERVMVRVIRYDSYPGVKSSFKLIILSTHESKHSGQNFSRKILI